MTNPIQDHVTLRPFKTEGGEHAIKDVATDETYILSKDDLTKCALAVMMTGAPADYVLFELFMIKSEEVNGLAHQAYVKWEATQDASEATIN